MHGKRFTLRAAVYLMFIKDSKILLVRRSNTGWQDGKYSFVAGHLEGRETVKQAMAREAKEEAGVELKPDNLHVAHVMHRKSNDNLEYIDFFLMADKWEGEARITEPEKCDQMKWFSLNNLPENLLAYVKKAIKNYQSGVSFSEFGF